MATKNSKTVAALIAIADIAVNNLAAKGRRIDSKSLGSEVLTIIEACPDVVEEHGLRPHLVTSTRLDDAVETALAARAQRALDAAKTAIDVRAEETDTDDGDMALRDLLGDGDPSDGMADPDGEIEDPPVAESAVPPANVTVVERSPEHGAQRTIDITVDGEYAGSADFDERGDKAYWVIYDFCGHRIDGEDGFAKRFETQIEAVEAVVEQCARDNDDSYEPTAAEHGGEEE